MATLEYFKAKAAEYAIVLSRIAKELQALKSRTTEHQWLLAYLQSRIIDAQIQHRRLQSIVQVGHPKLLARALPIVHGSVIDSYDLCYVEV